jgi:UMF1 family MFS transporter
MLQEYTFFGFNSEAEAIKASFVSVAIWWAIFSLPLLIFVKEEQKSNKKSTFAIKEGYIRLKNTFLKIKELKHLALFLAAYWLYIDGVDTIIQMAVDYGMALGFDPKNLILALLIVQFVGFPATLVLTRFSQSWNTKKMIYICISVYLFIVLWATTMSEVYEFYMLAVMIAIVQGTIQSLSRSYYSRMIPKEYSAEFFGFYNFIGKFAAIFGPLLVAVVALFTQNSRLSIASISLLFILGAILLYFVDEAKGEKELNDALNDLV